MPRKKTEGDNFSVDTPVDQGPAFSEISGIVSGEIEESPEADRERTRAERLERVQAECASDAQLAEIFRTADGREPLQKIERVLDAINAMRRDIEASDAAPDYKASRGGYLSDVANRLRELI